MTDWTARTLDVDFSFLPAGNFQMDAYEDGPNADRVGIDYKKTKTAVNRTSKHKISMARGGGWAARLISR
jgi:alpha-glucosidase